MPINRAPFNALVDDDGSGLTGTPWNKSAISGVLLDPIDQAITQPWKPVPFDAANFGALAPMTWTVGAAAIQHNRYCVSGKILFWSFYISWFSGSNVIGGSPTTTLYMTLPGGLYPMGAQFMLMTYTQVAGGNQVAGGLFAASSGAGAPRVEITRSVGGNFVIGNAPGMITTLIMEVV